MYLVGFVILVGGVLAALWKLGILDSIGTTWTVIGVVIAIGLRIMIAVSHSGSKENIEITGKCPTGPRFLGTRRDRLAGARNPVRRSEGVWRLSAAHEQPD